MSSNPRTAEPGYGGVAKRPGKPWIRYAIDDWQLHKKAAELKGKYGKDAVHGKLWAGLIQERATKRRKNQVMVTHASNPSTWKAEAGALL